jgi:hypothetical protein
MSLHAEAQRGPGAPPGMSVEQVQIERIAYFTEQIGLTPEEAQLFWPLYNEMDNKRKALFEEKAAMLKSFTENKNTNDKQINEQLNRLAAINGQECALHGEYDAKFRKMMSAQKVMNMYIAEIGFRNYLLQKIRKRRDSE